MTGNNVTKPGFTGGSRLWWSLRKKLCPSRRVVIPFGDGLRIGIRPLDRFARQIYLEGIGDAQLAAMTRLLLKPGMTVFDIGANIGQFTLIAAGCVGRDGQVHAFEAASDPLNELRQNVDLNELPQVHVHHAAVFEEPGEIEIKVCRPGQSEFNSIGRPVRKDEQIVGVEKVPAVTLDGFVAEHGLANVGLIKIDVEGAERSVLRGAQALLAGDDAPTLICEFCDQTTEGMGYSTRELRAQIEAAGYHVMRFDGKGSFEPEPNRDRYQLPTNLVCVKNPQSLPASAGAH